MGIVSAKMHTCTRSEAVWAGLVWSQGSHSIDRGTVKRFNDVLQQIRSTLAEF